MDVIGWEFVVCNSEQVCLLLWSVKGDGFLVYEKGIKYMRASGRLAAHVLQYAGTLVKELDVMVQNGDDVRSSELMNLTDCLPVWLFISGRRKDSHRSYHPSKGQFFRSACVTPC